MKINKGNLYFSWYASNGDETKKVLSVDDLNKLDLTELQTFFYSFANALGYQIYAPKTETDSAETEFQKMVETEKEVN